MRILIISGRDPRNRYRFISSGLTLQKDCTYEIIKNDTNAFNFGLVSVRRAFASKNSIDFVIMVGADFTGFFWLLLSKWVVKSKLILRLGGNPIDVRKRVLKTAYNERRYFIYLKLILGYWLTKIVLHYCDGFVFVNDSLVGELSKYVRDGKQFSIIPQPVKVSMNTLIDTRNDRDVFRLLTVSNLAYRDKYLCARKIIEMLIYKCDFRDFNLQIIYDIVGGGVDLDEIKDIVVRGDIDPDKLQINVRGFVRNVDIFYQNADIFVYCSLVDALPNVLLEAQSFGLPLVVNSCTAFRSVLKENINALFFYFHNEDEFCLKLRKLILDGDLRKSMGLCNLKNIEKNYSVGRIGGLWRDFLVRLNEGVSNEKYTC